LRGIFVQIVIFFVFSGKIFISHSFLILGLLLYNQNVGPAVIAGCGLFIYFKEIGNEAEKSCGVDCSHVSNRY
jgi:hypothetical protein